jgi:hypothetical protein
VDNCNAVLRDKQRCILPQRITQGEQLKCVSCVELSVATLETPPQECRGVEMLWRGKAVELRTKAKS